MQLLLFLSLLYLGFFSFYQNHRSQQRKILQPKPLEIELSHAVALYSSVGAIKKITAEQQQSISDSFIRSLSEFVVSDQSSLFLIDFPSLSFHAVSQSIPLNDSEITPWQIEFQIQLPNNSVSFPKCCCNKEQPFTHHIRRIRSCKRVKWKLFSLYNKR